MRGVIVNFRSYENSGYEKEKLIRNGVEFGGRVVEVMCGLKSARWGRGAGRVACRAGTWRLRLAGLKIVGCQEASQRV